MFMFPSGSLWISPGTREPQAEENTALTKLTASVFQFRATRGVIGLCVVFVFFKLYAYDFLVLLTLENWTDRLFQNVGIEIRVNAA
jgi:hypothetical protein